MSNRKVYLDELYRQYVKPLYFYLLKLCGSPEIAEDLTQEAFVQATIYLDTYDNEQARAWLFKVARNVYLDEWRKQQRRKNYPIFQLFLRQKEMVSPYGLPEEELLQQEREQSMEDLLTYLPEQYRSILYLREYQSFSYQEIMEALHLSEQQVKVTLHRARKRLAELAKKKGWEDARVE